MYFRIQRNSFLISFWCEGSYRSFSPIDMYPEYIFILENIQREIETICTKKHYKYGNYYNFTNPLDVRLKGFSQVEGGTSQSNWLPTYYILSFFFLSDPSPIIVYPCHSLTHWLTDRHFWKTLPKSTLRDLSLSPFLRHVTRVMTQHFWRPQRPQQRPQRRPQRTPTIFDDSF